MTLNDNSQSERKSQMAVGAMVVIRNFPKEQYEALRNAVGWLDEPPRGGISHVAWWEGDDCHGFDVWESEEAWAAFGQERMGPAMAKLGFSAQPEAHFFEADEVFLPRAVKLVV
jgi:hypothetical protein